MALSPSPTLYTIGSGSLFIAEVVNNVIGTYFEIGNCDEINLEMEETTLSKKQKRTNAPSIQEIGIFGSGYNLKFVADEMAVMNLTLFIRSHNPTALTLRSFQRTEKRYALRFVADNAHGPNYVWNFWKTNIAGLNSLNLISGEWQKMSFRADGIADTVNHPLVPLFEIADATEYLEWGIGSWHYAAWG